MNLARTELPDSLPNLVPVLERPDSFFASFRARFDELSLTPDAVYRFDLVGPDIGDSLRLPLQQWKAREEGSLEALAVAFLRLGECLTEAELCSVFGKQLAIALRATGLVTPAGAEGFGFRLKLGALGDHWIFSDRNLSDPGAVMGASAATSRIFDATLSNTPVDSLLDLGCGGAALGLALSSMSQRTCGSDISERALRFAELNRRVNGSPALDLRHGDLFEPVRGERFDRIVCQPPFIPSMDSSATFAAGGALGMW